jgi:hypothetical protein
MIFLIPWEGIAALSGFGSASRLIGLVVAASWLLLIIIRGEFRKITPFHVFVFLFFFVERDEYLLELISQLHNDKDHNLCSNGRVDIDHMGPL